MVETIERPARGYNVTDGDLAAAFPDGDAAPEQSARLALLSELHSYYTAYMGGPETFLRVPRLNTSQQIVALEDAWRRWEDSQVDAAWLPSSAQGFGDWFVDLATRHVQPEFCRYIAEDATLAEIGLFFMAEELVDSRFDDLVAMAQIGAAAASKLTMAENYWDEMGEGALERMHTRLFEHSAQFMRRTLADHVIGLDSLHCAEVYENACLVLMYGIHRHLAPRALGAMGLMEYSAPARFQAMVGGCTRLCVPEDVITYQRIHIHVDADHGAEWLANVLIPLVGQSPELLREVSMGVLTRKRIADAYYERIWRQMKALR
jgi:hypothetical protein